METYRLLDKLKETIQSDFRGKKVSLILIFYGDADNFSLTFWLRCKCLNGLFLNLLQSFDNK